MEDYEAKDNILQALISLTPQFVHDFESISKKLKISKERAHRLLVAKIHYLGITPTYL